MDRLIEIVRANPVQFVALAGFVLVVILAWAVESTGWKKSHR